jgi:hypothetical protein
MDVAHATTRKDGHVGLAKGFAATSGVYRGFGTPSGQGRTLGALDCSAADMRATSEVR